MRCPRSKAVFTSFRAMATVSSHIACNSYFWQFAGFKIGSHFQFELAYVSESACLHADVGPKNSLAGSQLSSEGSLSLTTHAGEETQAATAPFKPIVDASTDEEGWVYASDFHALQWTSSANRHCFVRRRRWASASCQAMGCFFNFLLESVESVVCFFCTSRGSAFPDL